MTAAAVAPAAPRLPAVLARGVRSLLGVVLAVVALAAVLSSSLMRRWEAGGSAWVLSHLFGQQTIVSPDRPLFFYQQVPGAPATWRALEITYQCTALFFVVPVLVLAAVLLLASRAETWRIVVAAAVSVTLLVVSNLLRAAGIAYASIRWGNLGFEWTHDAIGSGVMIAMFLVCLWLFIRLGVLGRGARRRRHLRQGGDRP